MKDTIDWDELAEIDTPSFTRFDQEVSVPKILASPFQSVIENSFGRPEGETTIKLLEIYADLVETLPEIQVQLGLRRASSYYFNKVLNAALVADITGETDVQQTQTVLQPEPSSDIGQYI